MNTSEKLQEISDLIGGGKGTEAILKINALKMDLAVPETSESVKMKLAQETIIKLSEQIEALKTEIASLRTLPLRKYQRHHRQ